MIISKEILEKNKKFAKEGNPDNPNHYMVNIENQIKKCSSIFDYISYFTGSKILEFGPGAGYAIFTGINYKFDIGGLEVSHEISGVHKILGIDDRIKFYNGIDNFPFEDNEFDFFLAKNSIHRMRTTINKDKDKDYYMCKRFEEISRVLKENSFLFLDSTNKKKFCEKGFNIAENNKNNKNIQIIELKGRL